MTTVERIFRFRLLQHLAFWSIAFYILLKNFKTSSVIIPIDLIYTSIFIVFLIVAVYINLLILIPRLFQKSRYIFYFISLVVLLGSMTWIYIVLFDVIVDVVFQGYYLISYFDFWDTMKYFIILIGISSLLHFSKSWFMYKESQARLSELQKEKVEAELSALKNQINPHFLFNSLNSIYSMVLKQSPVAPEALIRLSDTMRYVIYESNKEKVPLEDEIEFIRNYMALQQLRMSKKDDLKFEVDGDLKNKMIAPLLLIPIIENGFKYGIKGETEASFIHILIVVSEHQLTMTTKNNLGTVDKVERNDARGTGLSNLKKRLELIYPGQHSLIIDASEGKFTVTLSIEI